MTKKISEIEALQAIDIALEGLEEAQIQRIFEWISSKYKVEHKKMDSFIKNPDLGFESKKKEIDSSTSVKEFLAIKKPDNYYERIACIAFYLEKMKGLEDFKTVDITKANLEARLNKFPNPALYVGEASRGSYGYLTSVGSGKKALSIRGEMLVNALPDREKVKAVLAEHPTKKKPVKKNKK